MPQLPLQRYFHSLGFKSIGVVKIYYAKKRPAITGRF